MKNEVVARLVDKKTASSPEEARLRDLVQASEEVQVSDALKRQIYASVVERRPARRRQGSALLRPAVVFTILLVAAGATAAATFGRRWIAHKDAPGPLPAPPPKVAPVHPPRAVAAPAPEIVPAPVELPAGEPQTTRNSRPARPHARSEDPSQVVQAVEALRNQHDPDRAAKLLSEYLASHPRGALVEEALALSIEAAVARHDPAAAAFANRYLKDYPSGRFRRTAETALARH